MTNLLAISGRIGSGKDLTAKIIQYLYDKQQAGYTHPTTQEDFNEYLKWKHNDRSYWQVKKFADKLKDIACLLIGCTREQLEDNEFKSSPLGEEWIQYRVADGFWSHSDNNPLHKMMDSKECDKETYDAHHRINWQTAYKTHYTPRILMQRIGTELMRNQLLDNIWVNSLFSEYKRQTLKLKNGNQNIEVVYNPIFDKHDEHLYPYPKWIITDLRFPNEFDAVKQRGGICIRINRNINVVDDNEKIIGTVSDYADKTLRTNLPQFNHESETALDKHEFDYVINNDSNIEDLIEKVKQMLIHFKIL